MRPQFANAIPRTTYGLVMLIATAVACGAAFLVCSALGGTGDTLTTLGLALALGSFATFAPAVLNIGADHWGVSVLVAGVARALIILGYCYAARETNPAVASRPLFLGAASAAMLLLIVEAAASIRILAALERRKASEASPATNGNPA